MAENKRTEFRTLVAALGADDLRALTLVLFWLVLDGRRRDLLLDLARELAAPGS